jgi:hypothetical protein
MKAYGTKSTSQVNVSSPRCRGRKYAKRFAITKTEHNGAKRGKGFWGTKREAKTGSRKARRANDKKAIRDSQEG